MPPMPGMIRGKTEYSLSAWYLGLGEDWEFRVYSLGLGVQGSTIPFERYGNCQVIASGCTLDTCLGSRKAEIRLPGKRNSNSHGARPVHKNNLVD